MPRMITLPLVLTLPGRSVPDQRAEPALSLPELATPAGVSLIRACLSLCLCVSSIPVYLAIEALYTVIDCNNELLETYKWAWAHLSSLALAHLSPIRDASKLISLLTTGASLSPCLSNIHLQHPTTHRMYTFRALPYIINLKQYLDLLNTSLISCLCNIWYLPQPAVITYASHHRRLIL